MRCHVTIATAPNYAGRKASHTLQKYYTPGGTVPREMDQPKGYKIVHYVAFSLFTFQNLYKQRKTLCLSYINIISAIFPCNCPPYSALGYWKSGIINYHQE